MIRKLFLFFAFILPFWGCTQSGDISDYCQNPAFSNKINKTIRFTVPVISVQDLQKIQNEVHIFDAREKLEYDISHIEGARFIGFKDFSTQKVHPTLSKDAKIVVYCSIGYRSEIVAEKLKAMGYKNVFNLYGSIFEWANRGYKMIDVNGEPTTNVHTYNQAWSKWIDNNNIHKIW